MKKVTIKVQKIFENERWQWLVALPALNFFLFKSVTSQNFLASYQQNIISLKKTNKMEGHEAAVAIAIPITAILGFVGMMIILRKFDNDEKMAMIEKGLTLPQKQSSKVNPASALRWGCLFVGVGLGIFVANMIASVKSDHEALYPALIMVFGGTGLLVSYYIQLKIDERGK